MTDLDAVLRRLILIKTKGRTQPNKKPNETRNVVKYQRPCPRNSLFRLLVRGTIRSNNVKDGALLDLVLFNNLGIDVHKILNLKFEEILDSSDVSLSRLHRFADLLQHAAHATFHVLELIFSDLAVKVGKVGNWADSVENSLVADDWRAGPERGDHGDALLRAECPKSLMLDVTALEDNGATLIRFMSLHSTWHDKWVAYLGWPADLFYLPGASSQSCLTADHSLGVAHHQDADEWIAVLVPVDHSLLIILSYQGTWLAVANRCWNRDVHMANLVIDDRHKVDTCNFRNDGKSCRVLPSFEDKLSVPFGESVWHGLSVCVDILWSITADLLWSDVTGVAELFLNLVA